MYQFVITVNVLDFAMFSFLHKYIQTLKKYEQITVSTDSRFSKNTFRDKELHFFLIANFVKSKQSCDIIMFCTIENS